MAEKAETKANDIKEKTIAADDEMEYEDDEEETTASKILKIAIILFLLFAFIAGGFGLGLYFNLYDMEQVNEKLALYDYPVFNMFFEKPLSVIEREEEEALEKAVEEAQAAEAEEKAAEAEEKAAEEERKKAEEKAKLAEKEKEDAASGIEKPKTLTKEELEKQVKARKAEEKKRVTKLARLYNNMKPEDAAAIMEGLDDDIVIDIFNRMDEGKVSKIINAFDESRSARITKIMYTGKPDVSHVR
jgi:flagellar motility protein MotE (MotC chaperone)